VGVEGRAASWLRGTSWDLTRFAWLGGRGRTFSYRDVDGDEQSQVAGYGALGGEIGFGHFGYVSRRAIPLALRAHRR
jgi:hypothetical protein